MTIYQAVLIGEFSTGDDLRNIHHYEFPGYDPDMEELQEFVDGLAAMYEEFPLNDLAQAVQLQAIEVRRVDIGDQPSTVLTPDGWPISGDNAVNPLPSQVAALVTWKAPTAFPRSTRTYMFPYGVNSVTGTGRLTGGPITRLDAWALLMEEVAITGQTDARKVAVRYGGDPRAVIASNPVFAQITGNVFATQRSRRVGVGS